MRILLQYVLPILAPLIIYVTWLLLRGKGKKLPNWDEGLWFWLILLGLVFGMISLIFFGVSGMEEKGGQYIAPRFEDGKILPPERR
ncbi:MAG: hypothetical protein OQK35_07700 [Alphaproteobacteria bacterium]|nr:hypothetical protein [Rhodospirillales bacterium]MCW9046201.1 hypothetical protein [Alphaproteobacteria bacterium]